MRTNDNKPLDVDMSSQRVNRTIYLVVGAAHGGTTITTMLLGQHSLVTATGELTGFPDNYQITADNLCGCGKPATECSFWRSVCSDCAAESGTGPAPILHVYRSIFNHTGAKAIVDCHHGPARAAQLARLINESTDLELIIISISRPTHSVAGSQLRVALERNRIENRLVQRLKVVFRAVVSRKNILHVHRSDKLGCRVIDVDYIELCYQPLKVLVPIWNAAGLKTTNEACWLLGDKKFIHKPKHMIRGNHKLRQHDEIMLRRDTSVPALTRLESSLVTFLDMVPIVFFKLIWSAYKKFRNPFKHSEM